MDITFIRTYMELCKNRHFGKTAQSLFITQSAVSARIRHLEEQLGVKLLTRDRNNIQLTPAGTRFLRHAENIVSIWNLARQETALEDEGRSLLSVGGVYSLWDTVLTGWMGRLRESRPDLALHAEALDASNILTQVREGALDLGFLFESPRINQLELVECGALDLVLVSTTPGRDADEVVQSDDYILVDWGTEFLKNHARLFAGRTASNIRVSLGRLGLDQIVRFGGSAYLANDMVAPYVENGELFLVEEAPVIERKYYAVYSAISQRKELINETLGMMFGGSFEVEETQ